MPREEAVMDFKLAIRTVDSSATTMSDGSLRRMALPESPASWQTPKAFRRPRWGRADPGHQCPAGACAAERRAHRAVNGVKTAAPSDHPHRP
jgi:hypothetical protein